MKQFELVIDYICNNYFIGLLCAVILLCIPGWAISWRKNILTYLEVITPILSIFLWFILHDIGIGPRSLAGDILQIFIFVPLFIVSFLYGKLFLFQSYPNKKMNNLVYIILNVIFIIFIRLLFPNFGE
jgi:hypothetical protein